MRGLVGDENYLGVDTGKAETWERVLWVDESLRNKYVFYTVQEYLLLCSERRTVDFINIEM
jgi:hypothetical protein